MRGGFKIEKMYDESVSEEKHECPSWLDRFAKEYAEKEAAPVTAVEVARRRNAPSISDQISAIMGGPQAPGSRYSSVEEAVNDYAQRIGLNQYRKQALAMQIIANSEEEGESEKKKRPKLLDSNPAVDSYIHNIVDTNHSAQLPAILYNLGVAFSRDGVTETDLDDPDLARYINDLLTEKRKLLRHNEPNAGKYLGVINEDAGMLDNPWAGLLPAPRR